MRRLPLRAMMLVPLLATLALGSLGLGVFVHRAVEQDMTSSVDAELTRAAQAPRGAGPDGGFAPDGAEAIDPPISGVLAPDGSPVRGSDEIAALLGDEVTALAGATGTTTIDGDPRYRVASELQSDGTTFLVALSLRDVDASLVSLRRNLLLGGIVLVILQALIVGWVAGAVGRPVRRISQAAHRVSEGDLDADLGPPTGPRETATLTEDLTSMISQLRDTISRSDEAASEAMRARADMERFMADASHELRTPLTALRGYSDLFEAGMLDEDGLKRAMQRIGGESERLAVLVTDMLNLVRPSDTSARQTVDLAAIVSAAAYDLRAAHPSHQVTHDLQSDDRSEVYGDPARLHQAVLNLGANACQHTPSGTAVELAVRETAEAVTVKVVDHGPGVDIAAAEVLFTPFSRGDESRSRRSHDGAGLGLALVRRIADQHNGQVTVEPTPGGGATFCLQIPRLYANNVNS